MSRQPDLFAELGLQEGSLSSADVCTINERLYRASGIRHFFETAADLHECCAVSGTSRQSEREFGDFQTPAHLASRICAYLRDDYQVNPAIVIEPTFGQGSFICSAIDSFPALTAVYGVEVQKPYHWLAKQALVRQAQQSDARRSRPDIMLIHDDIFSHDFDRQLTDSQQELLIIGNPPWVTNSELGALNATNVPRKQNGAAYKGLDALTGKSNFDICEYIIVQLLETFKHCNATLAMLCKNSVAKKIVRDLPRKPFHLTDMKLLHIDAKKEFQAAADASLFVARIGGGAAEPVCDTYRLDAPQQRISSFGWCGGKFVSHIETYRHASLVDGCSPFIWRSGIKHDCASVMELDVIDGRLMNKRNEAVEVEDELLFGLLKSSDLKPGVITARPRKKVIVTQRKIGEDTAHIEQELPRTWAYLQERKPLFEARKSSIYKGKPDFSIFGVGAYSFAAYKVAISGMYKKSAVTFVPPSEGKAVMLDDTCYFLAFEDSRAALFTFALLNGALVQNFLQSVVFLDEKRPYTKDILMRIDLYKAAQSTSFEEMSSVLQASGLAGGEAGRLTSADYQSYVEQLAQRQEPDKAEAGEQQ